MYPKSARILKYKAYLRRKFIRSQKLKHQELGKNLKNHDKGEAAGAVGRGQTAVLKELSQDFKKNMKTTLIKDSEWIMFKDW